MGQCTQSNQMIFFIYYNMARIIGLIQPGGSLYKCYTVKEKVKRKNERKRKRIRRKRKRKKNPENLGKITYS